MSEAKKRGRPATGRYPMIGIRVTPTLRDAIVQWAERQPNDPSFSEAARRLIELGLASAQLNKPPSKEAVSKAAALATEELDSLKQVKAVAPGGSHV